jgi:hypothetical protein
VNNPFSADKKLHARMFSEPAVRRIFRKKVALLLPNPSIDPCTLSANDDPIYKEIQKYYHNNPGGALEDFFLRHYMRMQGKCLYDALDCASCGVQRESVASYVCFVPTSICGTAAELGTSELEFLLDRAPAGMQCRSAFGRTDTITPLQWVETQIPEEYANCILPPAGSQMKNWDRHLCPSTFFKIDSMEGALASLDPRTFFKEGTQDYMNFHNSGIHTWVQYNRDQGG